jgi:choline dehydrogenase-like flavoprotein
MDSVEVQIAVVGSGPGGSVAAMMLAEAGLDVLMIEEGSDLPLDSAPHFSREEILQKYRNAAINVAMAGPKVAWVEGRCVGGGSEVNRGLYHRTPDEVLERWIREHRVEGLTPTEMLPHFEACEAIAGVSHLPGEAPPLSLKLKEGAVRLGWGAMEVPRLVRYVSDGAGGWHTRKQSMTETAVPRFRSAGGRLLADTRVLRLSRESGGWRLRGERTHPGESPRAVEIRAKTVFIAGGAVQTPLLLRRSGLKHNIGDTLRFHPMIKVVARFEQDINTASELEPVHQVKEFDPRFSMGCSVSKRPALALALADRPELLPEVDRSWKHLGIFYVQSTGGLASVRALPGFRDPLVRVRETAADMRDLAEGLKRLSECLFAAGATAVYPALPAIPIVGSAAEIARFPDRLPETSGGVTAMHVFSSCPMGEDHARCATDSYGRVSGADGLHIADASLLPGPTVVNPQASVMAVVHRNVQRFLETHRPRARSAAASVGAVRA